MASLAELIRSNPKYKENYEWFVELAKNFHWIQSKMVESTDKVSRRVGNINLILQSPNWLVSPRNLIRKVPF